MASTIQKIHKPIRARALDTSGNNNHGQIYSGRALEFDGVTDYLSTGLVFHPEPNHTIAVWAKANSDGNWKMLVDGRDANDDGIKLTFQDDDQIEYSLNTADIITVNSDLGKFADRWVRIVATYDGSTAKIYVNGVASELHSGGSSLSTSQTFNTTTTTWKIGRKAYGTDNYFDGFMSDVQIWDTAWTQDDVTYDYLNPESLVLNRAGTSLTNSNLKIWYPMQGGHRGNQSYVLDASNTGLGDENIDLTTGSSTDSSEWSSATTSGISKLSGDSSTTYYDTGFNTVTGKTYKISCTISNYESDTNTDLGFSSTGGIGSTARIAGNGTVTHIFRATSDVDVNLFGRSTNTATFSNVSVKAVNDKNNATTVFYGDEQITEVAKNSTTFGSHNWADYNITGTGVAVTGSSGSEKLVVVTDDGSSDEEGISLAHSLIDGSGGAHPIAVGRTYRVSADLRQTAGVTTPSLQFEIGGNSSPTFTITASEVTYTKDIICENASGNLIIKHMGSVETGTTTFTVDNISVKEIGVASGWTDADQQLYIPQTALQSYNELAWSSNTYDAGASVLHAYAEEHADFNIQTSDFTVNYWVFLSSDASENASYNFHCGGGGGEGWHVRILNTGNAAFVLHDGSTAISVNSGDGVSRVPLGEWTMITGVVDHSTNIKMYINGELRNTTSWFASSTSIDGSGNVEFLNWLPDYDNGILEGTATEWSIFKNTAGTAGGALSQAEINELYNDGKPLDATTHSQAANLKGYWRNDGINTIWHNKVLTSNVVTINEAGFDSSETDLTVNDGGLVRVNDVLVIDDEELLVTAKATNVLTVVRGYRGTTGAAHDNGANISIYKSATLQNAVHGIILIPEGVDGSRDSQGFIMNKPRNTSSLNLTSRPFDYVETPADGSLDFGTNPFSIECWVKYGFINNSTFGETGSTLNVILSNWKADVSTIGGFNLLATNSDFVVRMGDGGGSNLRTYTIPGTPEVGNWYHIVVTRSGNTIETYINGEDVGGETNAGWGNSNVTATTPLLIGDDSGFDRSYKQPIDGVRVYSDVLSSTEVKRNYDATKGNHRN